MTSTASWDASAERLLAEAERHVAASMLREIDVRMDLDDPDPESCSCALGGAPCSFCTRCSGCDEDSVACVCPPSGG
jgi:hypothetical protein